MEQILFILSSLLYLLIPISSAQEFDSCKKDYIKSYTQDGVQQKEKLDFCTNKEATSVISKNCRNKKCHIFTKLPSKFKSIELKHSTFGNPGFHLCRDVSGLLSVINFSNSSGKEVSLNWCYFKADNSFIDVGSLENHYWAVQNQLTN